MPCQQGRFEIRVRDVTAFRTHFCMGAALTALAPSNRYQALKS